MRWKHKPKRATRVGDIRVKSNVFLLLPRLISGEWRWLERASYKQECVEMMAMDPDGNTFDTYGWVDLEWL